MEIEKEVAEFVDTIKKDPFKYYFQNKENKKVKWEEDKVYVDALYQGYLDACRTFKWEKDGKDNKEYIREIFEEKEIVGDMKNYLRADKLESFDEIHKKICVDVYKRQAVDYPDTLWCYGNHDVSYPWGRLETGYSPYAERMVISKFEELENSLKSPTQIDIMHRIDNVLFSHGGLTADFLKWLDEDLLDAEIDDVIAAVNDASHDFLWNDESPLWFRPQYLSLIHI